MRRGSTRRPRPAGAAAYWYCSVRLVQSWHDRCPPKLHSPQSQRANAHHERHAQAPHAQARVFGSDTRTPLEKRLDEMEREGTLMPPKGIPQGFLEPVARVPGALARFLDERHYRSPLPGLAGFLDERHYTSTLTGEEEEGQ